MIGDPESLRHRHWQASRIVLVLAVLGVLFLLYCTTSVAAKFRPIFDDLLGRLPLLTHLVLSIPPFVSVLCSMAVLAGLVYKEGRITNKTRTLALNVAVLVIAMLLALVFVTAVFVPFGVIITNVNH